MTDNPKQPIHQRAYDIATKQSRVGTLEGKLDGESVYHNRVIPNLKVDVLGGIRRDDGSIQLFLVEVKYSEYVSLIHLSQLVGYLHVAEYIPIGLLFLVAKDETRNRLSADMSELLQLNQIKLGWCESDLRGDSTKPFKVGVCYYEVGNGIDWILSGSADGLTSFDDTVRNILT